MTKIAPSPPPYCASCFTVRPEQTYIDFEAVYDGPVIRDENAPNGMVPVDDLVLCDKCLQEAFDLIDIGGHKAEIERLMSLLERAEADIEEKDRMISRLTMTAQELVEHPVNKPGGSGAFAGVADEIRREMTKQRRDRQERSKRVKAGLAKAQDKEGSADGAA